MCVGDRLGSRRRRGNHRSGGVVHHVLELLARLEIGNFLGGDFDPRPGLRVTPDPGLSLARAEAAEPADLDLVSRPQRAHDTVENSLHDDFGFLPGHLHYAGDFFNQIGLGHRILLTCQSVTKPQYRVNPKDLQALRLFRTAIFQTHDFFDGRSGCRGLALIIFQTGLFLVVRYGPQAEADFLLRLAHFDDLEIELLPHRERRFLRPAPARIARHLREVTQPFHAFGQLYESPKTGQPADPAVHRIAHLMVLEVAFPCVRLELLDAQRKTARPRIDVEDDRLDDLPLLQDLRGVLHPLGPREIGNVHQSVDTFLDLDEGPKIGHIADPPLDHRAHAVPAVDGGPRVRFKLLQAERNAPIPRVHLQDHRLHLVAGLHHLRRVFHPARPGHLADVDQAFHPGFQFDEGAVIGDIHDAANQ